MDFQEVDTTLLQKYQNAFFEHYKGGIYKVLFFGTYTEDKSLVVIYQNSRGTIWVRPAMEFMGEVYSSDHYEYIPRFFPLGRNPKPQNVETLVELMKLGSISFSYTKKDGTRKDVIGTTKLELLHESVHPKGTDIKLSENVVRYYDIEADGWRSFIKDNFIYETNPTNISNK